MSETTQLTDLRQEIEWKLCEQSPEYFFANYYTIAQVGKGANLFDLRDYQHEILAHLKDEDFIISLKARQIGMTTITVGYALWHAMFHENSPWLFISRGEGAAKKMLNRAKYAFFRLPPWMKNRLGNLVSDTQTMVEFENGSFIESLPATGGTGRGDSVYGAVLDECAWMEGAEDIWAAVEPLVYGKSILISTANGMGNFFHEIWLDSERQDTVWDGLFYAWDVVPSRDLAWYEKTRLSHRNRPWLFYQEYPSNPTEAFVKSGRVAFDFDALEYLDITDDYRTLTYDSFENEFNEFSDDEDNYDVVVKVWGMPEVRRDEYNFIVQQPNYVVSCDVAEGLEHGDYTVIKVFDANHWEEVASCRTHYPVEDLGQLLEAIGYLYHNALIIVERNNHGLVPLTYLKQNSYPRLYRHMPIARRSSSRRMEYGWHTNNATKPKMIKDMLKALRSQTIELHDEEFKHEASTFVSDGRGSYNAASGRHDDTIIAACIGVQALQEIDRFPVVFIDHEQKPITFDDIFNLESQPEVSILDRNIGSNETNLNTVKRSIVLNEFNVHRQFDE